MVDDLKYLKRGGRISPAAAVVGTMLDLKPIIVQNKEGKLVSYAKVRGRRRAISYMVSHTLESIVDPKESVCIILHADCPQDAEEMKKVLQEKLPDLQIRIDNVGPVVGAHCGPGTLACCFMGTERPV